MEQFVIKLKWDNSFKRLSNEQRGILFKVFFDYHQGLKPDFENDLTVEVLWFNLVNDVERMNTAYQNSVENGKKGGAPKGTIPWNKGKKKDDNSEPTANPTQRDVKGEDTLKEKEKYIGSSNEEPNINLSPWSEGYRKFLENFPPPKVRNTEEGSLIWESFSQQEKAEVHRHIVGYVRDNMFNQNGKYMKNSFDYLLSEMWLDMKPRSFIQKPVDRGMTNMTFITFYSNKYNVEIQEAQKFLYRTSTDREFSKYYKEYKDTENKKFKLQN